MSEPAPPRAGASTGERACLITGATGFIGGRLARRLSGDGWRVRCLARATSDTAALEALGVEIVRGDITDAGTLAAAVDGASHVVHCAALVSDWATRREIESVNVDGTRNLLAADARASVERFVHVSSTDVYGHPGGRGVAETRAPGAFRNWYSHTKLQAERAVARAQREHGLDAVVVRPATVYGPGSEDVVGEIARALRAGHMLLIDRGRAIAGLCYVENLLDAIELALTSTAARGQTLNVTDGLAVTWRQFTDDLAAGLGVRGARWSMPYPLASAVGVSLELGYRALRNVTGVTVAPLLSRQAVQVLGVDQDFSNARARETLGWEPCVGYAAGVRATVEWLRDVYLARS